AVGSIRSHLRFMIKRSEHRKKKPSMRDQAALKGVFELLRYLKPYRHYFIPAMIAMMITGGLVLMFPKLMGDLIGGAMMSTGGAEEVDVEQVLERRNRIAL